MRKVVDTNVLVMALRSKRGASFRLLSELPAKEFDIALTIPLYTEYQDVLSRPEILELGYTVNDIRELTRYISSISHKQTIYYLWRPWLKDPKDDMVLEAAFASQSKYIVTYNSKDFVGKGIEKSFGIKPVNVREFLIEIGKINK
ncbi:putative toxin-antitoxin system toxin component, PIN family [Chromatiales bacterium (ex Bugula neritina AB1)]|nr:putative toxin-antitoxin system toxin component, PIN family [Chromatiales bacterium (ex Bugula neritina AB1)]